jgi:hypothetical protein
VADFFTRSSPTRIFEIASFPSFTVFFSAIDDTISGGTALQRALSAIISFC